jgi:hypothetical protein
MFSKKAVPGPRGVERRFLEGFLLVVKGGDGENFERRLNPFKFVADRVI